jgi:ketosteroid isomerase-like protein
MTVSALAPVRAFYDAVANGDVSGIVSVLHPDLAWTEAEGFPYFSGTWRHPQEVVEKLLIPLARDWEGFAAKPREFLVNRDVVVAFGAYSGIARATNKPMLAPFAHRWQIRDGKLARFDMYTDTLLIHRAMH